MYLPRHFAEERLDVLHAAMTDHPLGLLVTHGAAGLDANPVPFMVDATRGPFGTLRAHVARANPLWKDAGGEVLVMFQGPQAYVSPGWYASKAEHGKVVPTWNYIVVQARGVLRAFDDAAWLRDFVGTLTDRHEAGREKPWQVGDAPDDFIAQTLKAIVGIEVELTALVGKWKVSQNRPAADREGVVRGLEAQGDDASRAMAEAVERGGG
jgi:transcriptional regulator